MMNQKKIGIVIIAVSIILGAIFIYYINQLSDQYMELGCAPTEECGNIESSLSITHFAFGVIFGLLALGVYLFFFSKGEEAVLRRLEEEKRNRTVEEKFSILLKALDAQEQKIMKMVRDQEGITQNTLQIKSGLSKAKLSRVLQELERRNLITRKTKGKTLQLHLKV